MAGVELLDFNQVQEQSPSSGDNIQNSGGLLTWNFRADPNLAWDPSQSFFVMDITVRTLTSSNYNSWNDVYIPDSKDFWPFFPLRAFSSMAHIIDGVTVAQSNQPYADKLMQEKYLHDTSIANMGNFESVILARSIDDGNMAHNLFAAGLDSGSSANLTPAQQCSSAYNLRIKHSVAYAQGGAVANNTYTVMFQPPFDLWTKHQRISGGNHQIQLNLLAADTSTTYSTVTTTNEGTLWGKYFTTTARGFDHYVQSERAYAEPNSLGALTLTTAEGSTIYTGLTQATSTDKRMFSYLRETYVGPNVADTAAKNKLTATAQARAHQFWHSQRGIAVTINSIRLMRRMVRFTLERPIGNEEFNCTEMAFYHGVSSSTGQTQNFLLPASTFGIAFYLRSATDSYYTPIDSFPTITTSDAVVANQSMTTNMLRLNNFYFTYGGETYPSQRISNLWQGTSSVGPGAYRLQLMTHMLQGVLNTDMDRYNVSFDNAGLLSRLDASAFFFPVAKNNNSDNSDLQVYWDGSVQALTQTYGSFTAGNLADLNASLVLVAFYDSRVDLTYNSLNQLEKVTKTEWK